MKNQVTRRQAIVSLAAFGIANRLLSGEALNGSTQPAATSPSAAALNPAWEKAVQRDFSGSRNNRAGWACGRTTLTPPPSQPSPAPH